MSKHFKKGDMVSGTKWNGEPFVGIYELTYDCGEHCIFDGKTYYSIHLEECKNANAEEKEIIRKTIIKYINDKPAIGTTFKTTSELQEETEEILNQEMS